MPRWAKDLITKPARYRGAYGGRGSGKSHLFAEYILARAMRERTDIVCVREVQRSLKESVKKLFEEKIQALGVGHMFEVLNDRIRTPGGGRIIFHGVS